MYFHRCGNQMSRESLFCNRCGAKAQTGGEQEQASEVAKPSAQTPRPARRRPVAPPKPAPKPVSNYQEQDEEPYEEDENLILSSLYEPDLVDNDNNSENKVLNITSMFNLEPIVVIEYTNISQLYEYNNLEVESDNNSDFDVNDLVNNILN